MEASDTPELPLSERAYRDLRAAIVRCEFGPGERLRVEDLSRRLEVSSSPVREALNRLTEQGFVRSIDHRGFRVAPLTVADIRDLTRVRALVEAEALRDAMAHGDDAWEAAIVAAGHTLARVEERLAGQHVALDDDWSGRHRSFHLACYAACRSPLLLQLVEELFDRAERYRRFSASRRSVEVQKHTEHDRLMRKVLSRDADAAVAHFLRHIRGTEARVVTALESLGTRA